MNESSITVVVPVWNGRRWIAPLLATLRGQTLAPAQILVVDNGSTDGAAEEAARGGARVLAMGHNRLEGTGQELLASEEVGKLYLGA